MLNAINLWLMDRSEIMSEKHDTKISVIIPTYNRSGTIVRAIKSAQEQSYPVSEIIIVDDASSDDTKQ